MMSCMSAYEDTSDFLKFHPYKVQIFTLTLKLEGGELSFEFSHLGTNASFRDQHTLSASSDFFILYNRIALVSLSF